MNVDFFILMWDCLQMYQNVYSLHVSDCVQSVYLCIVYASIITVLLSPTSITRSSCINASTTSFPFSMSLSDLLLVFPLYNYVDTVLNRLSFPFPSLLLFSSLPASFQAHVTSNIIYSSVIQCLCCFHVTYSTHSVGTLQITGSWVMNVSCVWPLLLNVLLGVVVMWERHPVI